MIIDNSTDEAVRQALGSRAQAQRLGLNKDQETFAYEAGISVSTLYRMERGEPVNIDVYIRVLRVLGMLNRMGALVPETELSPMQQVKYSKVKERQRATGRRKVAEKSAGWQGFKEQVKFEDNNER